SEGEIEPGMVRYVVDQIRDRLIPELERISGRRYDEAELARRLALSALAENDLVWVLESAKQRPSPIDAYFGGVYYIGPIFSAFRGTEEGAAFYRLLREEVEGRLAAGLGPETPEGTLVE